MTRVGKKKSPEFLGQKIINSNKISKNKVISDRFS